MFNRFAALLFLSALAPLLGGEYSPARAVSMDKSSSPKDVCVVQIGPDAIQLSGYQPDFSREKYCDEFPSTGKIILVFDLAAESLRESSLEIRIIANPIVPLSESAELNAAPEIYVAPKTYRSGTFSVEHDFKESGHYLAIVTATTPEGQRLVGRFAFSVGETLLHIAPIALGGGLILGLVLVYWKHGASRPPGRS